MRMRFSKPFPVVTLLATFILAFAAAVLAGTITNITWLQAQLQTGETAAYLAAGPDGNVWATEQAHGQILKIDPATRAVTRFALPTSTTAFQITAGPDANLWFTAIQPGSGTSNVSVIGKITTSGNITIFPYPDSQAFLTYYIAPAIVGSSDGSVYVANTASSKIGRISPATGAVSEIPLPSSNATITDLDALSDGSVAITEYQTGKLARLANGVITEFILPSDAPASPTGVSDCTLSGNSGVCVVDSNGFIDTGPLGPSLNFTQKPLGTRQCVEQSIGCTGSDCFATTLSCSTVIHVDTSVIPPVSNSIAGPVGVNTSDIKILGPSLIAITAVASASQDFGVFIGTIGTASTCTPPIYLTDYYAGLNLHPTIRIGSHGFVDEFAASNAISPVAYSHTGNLPPGWTLEATAPGRLEGPPEEVGVYTFTVIATDSIGCKGELTFTVTILPKRGAVDAETAAFLLFLGGRG